MVGSPCWSRDSQESSPAPQFEGILRCSAFFIVQLSHPYKTTGKTIVLTTWTFVGKVMSLLFNTLWSFVIALSLKEQMSFNFMAAVTVLSDFGVQENKVCHCLHCFCIYLPWSNGTRCHDLCFVNVEFYAAWACQGAAWKPLAQASSLKVQGAGTDVCICLSLALSVWSP